MNIRWHIGRLTYITDVPPGTILLPYSWLWGNFWWNKE